MNQKMRKTKKIGKPKS